LPALQLRKHGALEEASLSVVRWSRPLDRPSRKRTITGPPTGKSDYPGSTAVDDRPYFAADGQLIVFARFTDGGIMSRLKATNRTVASPF